MSNIIHLLRSAALVDREARLVLMVTGGATAFRTSHRRRVIYPKYAGAEYLILGEGDALAQIS